VRYEIEVNGRARTVIVERSGDRFAVSVDGQHFVVDAARAGADSLSMIVATAASGAACASYEATLTPNGVAGQLAVRIESTTIPVAMNGRRLNRGAGAGDPATGPQRLLAPMPGKIVRVLVEPGTVVAARQPLVVVEAMKMENEVRATSAGTVVELPVREGQSVDAGTLLAVIDRP
jgi:biotin carboxyl carrier protein